MIENEQKKSPQPQKAAFLISAAGISSTFGRLVIVASFSSFFFSRKLNHNKNVLIVLMVHQALCSVLLTLFGKQCLLQYLSLAIQICLSPHYNHFISNPSRKLFVNSNHHLWMYRIMAGLICDQGRLHPMSLTLVFIPFQNFQNIEKMLQVATSLASGQAFLLAM